MSLPMAAHAQSNTAAPTTTAAPPSAGETSVSEIVVTGTRVARSRLDTLAPVDVVTTASLAQQATPELAQALSNLAPSLDFPRPAITDGTDSVRPATLRGLAPDQTLVLINGQRGHSSALVNVNGSIGRGSAAFDLNTIPVAALERVEVLRDGASAQYGSDAIAGVINLILRHAREGGSASVTYGNYDTDVVTARNPNGRHANDGPTYQITGWQGLPLGADGFLTVSGEYVYRNPTNRSDLDPRLTPPAVTARYGDPRVESKTFYANAGLPLGNGWDLHAYAGYQNRDSDSAANPRLANNANNVLSIFPGGFLPLITTDIDDYNLSGGVKGEYAGFSIDATVSYGKNRVHYGVINSVNGSLGAASPTTFDAGVMDYDQTVASLNATKPFDFGRFGMHFYKPSTFAFGAEFRNESYSISRGDVASYTFGGLAGKAAGAQGFPGFKPSNEVDVDRHSGAFYLDLDTQVTSKLDVDLAFRFEDYSDFGSTANVKAAARYDFTDSFAVRGSISTGFRAPSLQQQFFTATSTNFLVIGGVSTPVDVGTFPATAAVSASLGAKPLQSEDSTNYGFGATFHRGGLELTLDAYEIDIDNRIVLSENIQGTPTGSATAVAIYNLINSTPGSALGAARFFINGVNTETRGLDAVARYRLPTDFGRFDFTLSGNLNKTEVTKIPTTTILSGLPVPPVLFDRGNRLTFEKGTPSHKYTFATDYTYGPFSATLRVNHYGSVLVPNNLASLDYTTGSHTLVDIEGRYKLPYGVNFALGVQNIGDEYPNPTPTNINTNGPIGFPSYSPFGFNGRYIYARLSKTW